MDKMKLDVTCGMCIDAACAVVCKHAWTDVCLQSVFRQVIGTHGAMQYACACLNSQDVSSV